MTQTNELSPAAAILAGKELEAEETQALQEPVEIEESPATVAEESPTETPATYTVKELAAERGVTPAELYEQLTIDVGGEQVPLGTYKDRAKDLSQIDKLNAQALAQKAEVERDYLAKSRALQAAAERSKVTLTDELQQEIQAEYQKYVDAEGQKLLEVVPEWSDTDLQRIDLNRIEKTMRSFGFSDVEVESMVDHRLRLAFHQLGKLAETLDKAAKSEVKRSPKQAPRGQRKRSAGTVKDLVKAAHDGKISENAAIIGLIAGGNQHGNNEP